MRALKEYNDDPERADAFDSGGGDACNPIRKKDDDKDDDDYIKNKNALDIGSGSAQPGRAMQKPGRAAVAALLFTRRPYSVNK